MEQNDEPNYKERITSEPGSRTLEEFVKVVEKVFDKYQLETIEEISARIASIPNIEQRKALLTEHYDNRLKFYQQTNLQDEAFQLYISCELYVLKESGSFEEYVDSGEIDLAQDYDEILLLAQQFKTSVITEDNLYALIQVLFDKIQTRESDLT